MLIIITLLIMLFSSIFLLAYMNKLAAQSEKDIERMGNRQKFAKSEQNVRLTEVGKQMFVEVYE